MSFTAGWWCFSAAGWLLFAEDVDGPDVISSVGTAVNVNDGSGVGWIAGMFVDSVIKSSLFN